MDPEIVKPDTAAPEAAAPVEATAEPQGVEAPETSPVTEETTDAKQPASMLEAVQAAIQKDRAAESSDAESRAAPEAKPDEAKPAQADEPKADDDAKLPFHNHPRFKQLTDERKRFKEQAESFKADAEQFRQIRQVQERFSISNNEMADTIKMAAMLKTDPLQAFEILTPIYDKLAEMAGKKLPADLQAKVEDGKLDAEDAQELARTRAKAALTEKRAADTEQQLTARTQADLARANQDAVLKWESQIKSTDPDYKAKESFMTAEVQALMARFGPPANPQESLELVQTAHRNVSERLKAIMPQRPAARTLTSDQSAAAPRVAVQPKTMLEAVRAAAAAPNR